MRTVIAPLDREVEAQIEGLDDQLAVIARGYTERLRLEPYLGQLVSSGYLAAADVRRVRFDRESRPGQLFTEHRGRLRIADEDPSKGPRWRVVYELLEAPRTGVRVVRVLGVGRGHGPRRDRCLRGGRGNASPPERRDPMSAIFTSSRRYHQLMAALPTPARMLKLSSINADYRRYRAELEQGGAIIVQSDDGEVVLGVLTRDASVFGDAQLAQQIEAGHLPPLEELLAESVDETQPAS